MKTSQALSYLTPDIPAIGAGLRQRCADFRVEEIPLYLPCGEGEHTYARIQKEGISTHQAVRTLARALDISQRQIGVAGLKDARGVTVQWMSFQAADPAAVKAIDCAGLRVLEVVRHRNKLRIGHLAGNHFVLKLRDVDASRIPDIEHIADKLKDKGIPNFFGSQRFGMRGDTWMIGQALLKEDYERAADLIAGSPGPLDSGRIMDARNLFASKKYEEAARLWPSGFGLPAHVCKVMSKTGGNARTAVRAIDKRMRWFFFTAFQSRVFNDVLAKRLTSLDLLIKGDLAYKHDSGAVFCVEDAGAEQQRAARFEISPSGPLYGYRMTQPSGRALEMETEALKQYDLTLKDFPRTGPLRCPGSRRSLRIPLMDFSMNEGNDEMGPFVCLQFSLPSGGYATTVLREIFKQGLREFVSDKAWTQGDSAEKKEHDEDPIPVELA